MDILLSQNTHQKCEIKYVIFFRKSSSGRESVWTCLGTSRESNILNGTNKSSPVSSCKQAKENTVSMWLSTMKNSKIHYYISLKLLCLKSEVKKVKNLKKLPHIFQYKAKSMFQVYHRTSLTALGLKYNSNSRTRRVQQQCSFSNAHCITSWLFPPFSPNPNILCSK